jgi:hypothetical protein
MKFNNNTFEIWFEEERLACVNYFLTGGKAKDGVSEIGSDLVRVLVSESPTQMVLSC